MDANRKDAGFVHCFCLHNKINELTRSQQTPRWWNSISLMKDQVGHKTFFTFK